MHIFDYENAPAELLTPEIVHLLTRIHEYRGAQQVLLEQYGDRLIPLRTAAERQSDQAAAMEDETYRGALEEIRSHFDRMIPSPALACTLHARLFPENGGKYRDSDTVIRGTDSWGDGRVRFYPCRAERIEPAMLELFAAAERALAEERHDALLVIAQFVIDFLSIHPFADGNGKTAWLLQTLLLYRAGYYISAYVSLERLIEQDEEAYQEALQYSSIFWQDGTNSYAPFARWFLQLTDRAYQQFAQQTAFLLEGKQSKAERIRDLILKWEGPISKRQIREQYPDISVVTVERALTALVKDGILRKTGGGPSTAYVKTSREAD